MSVIMKLSNRIKNINVSVVAKATLWFMVCSIIQKSMSLITIPIFTRVMTTEQMGQYTTYTTWMQIITIITTLRLDYGVFNKGISVYSSDKEGYTSSMLGTTTILAAFYLIVYLIFRKPINSITELGTVVTVLIFAELLVAPSISFWSLNQRYDYKYKSVVAVTLSMTFMHTLLGLVFVMLTQEKGFYRIVANALVQIIFGLIIFIVCIRRSKKLFCKEYIRYAVVFNIPLLPHYFSSYILEQSDKIMILKMVGKSEMGIYGVACSIAQVIKIVTSSITNSLLPWQYRELQDKQYEKVGKKITSIVLLVGCVIVCFILFAPEIMMIMASREYYEAMYIIPPISCSVLLVFYFGLLANIEFFFEKNKFVMYISCVCAVANIIINYIGIKFFGYLAASYATFICYAFSGLCHLIYTNRLVRKANGRNILNQRVYIGIIVFLTCIIISMQFLYNHMVLRYLTILVMMIVLFIYRKRILQMFSTKNNK